jgi:hypothetical protein
MKHLPLPRVAAWTLPFVVALPAALFIGACAQDSNTTAVGGGGYVDPDASADSTVGPDATDSSKPDVQPDTKTDTGAGGSDGGGDGAAGSGGSGPCVPKTCQQIGAECGNATDGCGSKLSCGTCQTGKQCGGGGANKCGTNACALKTCIQVGASCGYASDGCADVVDCGKCPAPGTCGGGGKENQCGCTPKTCLQLGASCGSAPDGCGGKVDCGTCTTGTCGGGGVANACGAGTCAAKTCSQLAASCGFVSDGCGVAMDCGKCADPNTCGGGGTVYQCGCAAKSCIQLGASCGPMPDGCGKTVDCGACPSGEVCGGAGVAHQCGCKCSIPHATTSCIKGVCTLVACEAGWSDCDGDKANGCEVSTSSDLKNCGQCSNVCAFDHAPETCVSGACQMGACEPGWSDCNANPADGCEQVGDLQHCGSCTNDCTVLSLPHVTTPSCNVGQCAIGTCESGWVDQNKTTGDGCECGTDTAASACSGATALGPNPFALGGNASISGTLVPNGQNDWYVVHFGGNNSCSYHPHITLADNSGTGLIRMDVDMSSACASTFLDCSEGGTSAGRLEWEFTYQPTCAAGGNPDPAKLPSPNTAFIRVYATAASTTCLGYSLTVTN